MEKTSKKYAEKLAAELIPYDKSNSHAPIQWEKHKGKINKYRETAVEFYLKAVEETNVKELREALEEMYKSCKPKRFGVDLLDTDLTSVGSVTTPSELAILKMCNALNKTKS